MSEPAQPASDLAPGLNSGSVSGHPSVPVGPDRFDPVAGLLACLFPGLGYVYYGEMRRAAYVAVGVLGLYVGGLFVAGVSIVDRTDDRWWFYLQCGVGPSTLALDHINQGYKRQTRTGPVPGVAYERALGRVYEVGALSAGLAGMVNLIAIIDCFWHATPVRRTRRKDAIPTL